MSLPAPDATAQAQAVATAPVLKKRKPLVNDPLSKQDSNHWPENGHSSFQHGVYVIANGGSAHATSTCLAGDLFYHDVAVQLDGTLIPGDSACIMFRATPDASEFYEFMIGSSQFMTGHSGPGTAGAFLFPPTSSNAIQGPGKANRLLVMMKGGRGLLALYQRRMRW